MSKQLTETDRAELAAAVMALFDRWKVNAKDCISLLGLSDNTKPRALTRYRSGTPFPDDKDLLHRVESFLTIDEALNTTFPHNQSMGALWLVTPNRRFADRSPLNLMLEQGMEGIYQVRGHLDCTFQWY